MGLFWLSNQPELAIPKVDFSGADKIAHALLFGGLAACLSIGIRLSNDKPPFWAQWFVPFVFVILYGMSDEWHQSFVPGRSPDLRDVMADGIGGTIAQLALFMMWGRERDDGGK